jgi:lipid II:glycine glycyltransferase (peptidoglycan interpeptide bridge formation enzyme)
MAPARPDGDVPASGLSIAADQGAWDAAAEAGGGHLLQSWRWGVFKARHGWRVERVAVASGRGVAQAQVLFVHRGPLSIGYVPRGPIIPGEDAAAGGRLFGAIDGVCRAHGAVSLIVEPNERLPFRGRYRAAGFVRGPAHIQPSRTVIVPLLEDEALLGQMHQKTRYNIRLAQRRGVTAAVAEQTPENVAVFYGLLRDTSDRNDFGIHSLAYYEDFLAAFGGDAVLIFAWSEGRPVAGVIAARFGRQGIYMYGASSTEHRAHGAGFYIQFEAMRWARELGCTSYDLWGIPASDPPTTELDGGNRVAGTRGEDWRGLYEFKVRFGGRIAELPPTLERRYQPLLAALARRFSRLGG